MLSKQDLPMIGLALALSPDAAKLATLIEERFSDPLGALEKMRAYERLYPRATWSLMRDGVAI